jgi:hypothetical protein
MNISTAAMILIDDREADQCECHQAQDIAVVARLIDRRHQREPKPVDRQGPKRDEEEQEQAVPIEAPKAQEEQPNDPGTCRQSAP